jgi:dTDP-4-dehydrorhamnose reductase
VKILVTGSNGQLGKELTRQGPDFHFEIFPYDLPDLDITDPGLVEDIFAETRPDLIVNAAAYTLVDQAEDEPDNAFAVNRDGPECLARACRDFGIPMVHISTDYVFSGDTSTPYREQDPISPMGVYGRSKAAGDARVRTCLKNHIIVRTSWLYGVYGNNFVKTMLRIGKENKKISVVSDQYGCPTSAADLAEALLGVAAQLISKGPEAWGTYHFCNEGVVNWCAFAEEIFRIAERCGQGSAPMVEPITTDQYPVKAKRPPFSALSCDRIKKNFNITQRPWGKSLSVAMERIFSENNRYGK